MSCALQKIEMFPKKCYFTEPRNLVIFQYNINNKQKIIILKYLYPTKYNLNDR